MTVFYNDNEPFIKSWVADLIKAGELPEGIFDDSSIKDINADALEGYTECHFFAGIGGWPLALRMAGWPAEREVWTGSCPCQPFSIAGQRKGTADDRHLWPAFRDLIAQCRPATVFGEQVASKDGRLWLAGVRADLETLEYAVGAADLCVAGVGAPHIRQRLWWVAHTPSARQFTTGEGPKAQARNEARVRRFERGCVADGWLANADGGQQGHGELQRSGQHGQQPQDSRVSKWVADAECDPRDTGRTTDESEESAGTPSTGTCAEPGRRSVPNRVGDTISTGLSKQRRFGGISPSTCSTKPWQAAWGTSTSIMCLDGKSRRVEPGIFPLAHGVPNRVGTLRGAGNAIVPQVAAEFIRAFLETEENRDE